MCSDQKCLCVGHNARNLGDDKTHRQCSSFSPSGDADWASFGLGNRNVRGPPGDWTHAHSTRHSITARRFHACLRRVCQIWCDKRLKIGGRKLVGLDTNTWLCAGWCDENRNRRCHIGQISSSSFSPYLASTALGSLLEQRVGGKSS